MRRKIFVLLTVSAVLAMALAGCTQTAQDRVAQNNAAQTDDSSYGQSAERIFLHYGIIYEYDTQVPLIINRKGTGICPMEDAVKDIEDPEKGMRF